MVLAGFGMMVQMASGNTVLQTIVDEDKRGRVMIFIPCHSWEWCRLAVCSPVV